ncbi:Uncharacterised protein [Mycobacteroides abscessus]|nr:Uncharacterised protein [Mycobacteroides abscessus]
MFVSTPSTTVRASRPSRRPTASSRVSPQATAFASIGS